MSYRLSLISDKRLLNLSTIKFQNEDLHMPSHALDSTLFGANVSKQNKCLICHNSTDDCPSHSAVIELPIPIINTLCINECVKLLSCLCPICSHLLLDEEVLLQIKKIDAKKRFKEVVAKVKSLKAKSADGFMFCPNCQQQTTTIELYTKYPYKFVQIFTIRDPTTLENEILNPIYAMQVLQKYTQLEEIGFSKQFHPKNFMTSLIPIIPTKLRAKSLVNGTETASALTTYYCLIVENIVPRLNEIKNFCLNKNIILIDKSKIEDFFSAYALLQACHLLITDVGSDEQADQIQAVLNNDLRKNSKRSYRTGFDTSNSLISKFKGKSRSIFNKGMLGLVHDMSARVVLGAGEDVRMQNLIVPITMANKLFTWYPVYKENIKFMKQLILANLSNDVPEEADFKPRVIGILAKRNQKFQKVSLINANAVANLLQPGDKVGVSLCNHDFVVQNRHPSIREESLTSFQVQKSDISTVGIPLAVCEIKQADFDGDEIQIFCCSGHATDIEQLMSHSVYAQLKSYTNGGLAFYYKSDHDDNLGVSRIGNFNLEYYNHQKNKPTNILSMIEKILPKDLEYHSKNLIISQGIIDKEKCNFKNVEFYKYYGSIYGEDKCTELIDLLEQLGYDINREYGASLGFEIRYWCSKQEKEKIQESKKLAYMKATEIIKNKGFADYSAMNEFQAIMPNIKKTLLESAEGKNFDKMGYTGSKPGEYMAMIVNPEAAKFDGGAFTACLTEGTRTNFGGYKYSFDPTDYGYVSRGYAYDMSPYNHYFIMTEEWRAIYVRTRGVAKQGYMTNKMTVLFDRAFVDYNGCLCDGTTLLSNQYGACGLECRLEVTLEMKDLELSEKEFDKKYKDEKLQKLHKELKSIRDQYKTNSAFIKNEIKNILITGIDFNQMFIDKYKGKTEQKEIDKFIEKINEIFVPKALQNDKLMLLENFKSHEYYFRIKLLEYKLCDELEQKIVSGIENMLANAGDPVGVKAAIACSAPLTQSALSAIHNANAGGADVDLVKRPDGLTAFLQLLAGAQCKDDVVLGITLLKDDKESCQKFAGEQETFYFNDVWAVNELHISTSFSKKIIDLYGNIIENEKRHPYYVVSTWNVVRLSCCGIKITEIINAVMRNNPEIKFMLPYVINKSQINVNIYFKESVNVQTIHKIMQEWNKTSENNIVHGGLIKHCYVVETANNPGHYIIEANEAVIGNNAINTLIYDERVDPTRCRTSNPKQYMKLYGVFEGEARHFEQLAFTADNLADTKATLSRNYMLIAAVQTADGKLVYADANSMVKSRFGEFMKKCKFERAGKFIKEHLQRGEKEEINEFTSANVFSEMPALGSTVSKYVIYPNAE